MCSCRSLHGSVDRNQVEVRLRRAESASLPSRERGSKPKETTMAIAWAKVAPFTGAWIETFMIGYQKLIPTIIVAPFTGAWIETPRQAVDDWHADIGRSLHGSVDRRTPRDEHGRAVFADQVAPFTGSVDRKRCRSCGNGGRRVAPFTGAWIETPCRPASRWPTPVWVAPFAGAWIETRNYALAPVIGSPSLPSRERGSRTCDIGDGVRQNAGSLPSRERGSGTATASALWLECRGRSLRGSVDRNFADR